MALRSYDYLFLFYCLRLATPWRLSANTRQFSKTFATKSQDRSATRLYSKKPQIMGKRDFLDVVQTFPGIDEAFTDMRAAILKLGQPLTILNTLSDGLGKHFPTLANVFESLTIVP